MDELGYFYMRWSDNDGLSWSDGREEVPYPNTWVDRQNTFKGKTYVLHVGNCSPGHIKVLMKHMLT